MQVKRKLAINNFVVGWAKCGTIATPRNAGLRSKFINQIGLLYVAFDNIYFDRLVIIS